MTRTAGASFLAQCSVGSRPRTLNTTNGTSLGSLGAIERGRLLREEGFGRLVGFNAAPAWSRYRVAVPRARALRIQVAESVEWAVSA